jgi:hypothetical protein
VFACSVTEHRTGAGNITQAQVPFTQDVCGSMDCQMQRRRVAEGLMTLRQEELG